MNTEFHMGYPLINSKIQKGKQVRKSTKTTTQKRVYICLEEILTWDHLQIYVLSVLWVQYCSYKHSIRDSLNN